MSGGSGYCEICGTDYDFDDDGIHYRCNCHKRARKARPKENDFTQSRTEAYFDMIYPAIPNWLSVLMRLIIALFVLGAVGGTSILAGLVLAILILCKPMWLHHAVVAVLYCGLLYIAGLFALAIFNH